jgi:hypothetical protein
VCQKEKLLDDENTLRHPTHAQRERSSSSSSMTELKRRREKEEKKRIEEDA